MVGRFAYKHFYVSLHQCSLLKCQSSIFYQILHLHSSSIKPLSVVLNNYPAWTSPVIGQNQHQPMNSGDSFTTQL